MREQAYVRSLFSQEDEVLQSIAPGLAERGFPQISVPAEVGKTLYLLAKLSGARRILEIGALGGYSTIWLARALPETGELVSLELKEEHAEFARENVAKAGLSDRVSFIVGNAKESLDQLVQADASFDFFFIDADKPNYLYYLKRAIQLASPHAVITADNLFQHGRIFDQSDKGTSPATIRQFNQRIAEHPQLESIILTIGDGLGICRVKK